LPEWQVRRVVVGSVLLVIGVAACGAAARPAEPPAPHRYCDAGCWEHLHVLAETCRCTTEACGTAAMKRMVAWVTEHVIEPQHLSEHEQEHELVAELAPYDAIEAACLAKLPAHVDPFAANAVVAPLPPPMGIAACDDLLVHVTRCAKARVASKLIVRAEWDIQYEQQKAGVADAEIAAACTTQADFFARTYPGC
jgi:hypothetical protein